MSATKHADPSVATPAPVATGFLNEATECVPEWAYDEGYYQNLVRCEKVYLKTDPIKGKGLFAKTDLPEGETVLCETALCCSQNVDDFVARRPVCGNCMRSVEEPKNIVRRICGRDVANQLPKCPVPLSVTAHACKNKDKGCTMVFCSQRCRDAAWRSHHFVGCRGAMGPDAQKAFDDFVEDGWVHSGVDLSDTHFLALRFLCFVITRHRLHRMPLSMAFFPVGQLIRAPISKFVFSYLLEPEYEEAAIKDGTLRSDETEAEKRARRWATFLRHQADPSQHPAVQHQRSQTDPEKLGLVKRAAGLMRRIVEATPEEAAFLSDELWSEVLGAVLLNGQERAPNSLWVEYKTAMKAHTNTATSLKDFTRRLKSTSVGDDEDFSTSTRGQGIYTVGACFNHSCSPNVQVQYGEGDDEMINVVTLRKIKKDEELFISYIDEKAPIQQRQQHLFEHYLFTCACTKCNEQKAKLLKGEAIKEDESDAASSKSE